VNDWVDTVSRLLKGGEDPLEELKEQEAPVGNPEAQIRLTVCGNPVKSVALIVLLPDDPAATVMLPEFEIEKSNGVRAFTARVKVVLGGLLTVALVVPNTVMA
jgi:hypothetical protein